MQPRGISILGGHVEDTGVNFFEPHICAVVDHNATAVATAKTYSVAAETRHPTIPVSHGTSVAF